MVNRRGKIFFFFLLSWILLCAMGGDEVYCRSLPQPQALLKSADACRKSLAASSKKRKFRHNWMKCINLYQGIYKRYPKSDEAAWSVYHSARLYRQLYKYSGLSRDLDRAIELFRTLAAEMPEHRLADDAQYKIGEIYLEDKKDPTQAYVEYLKVDIKFPSGDMRPKARVKMDRVSTILSNKDGGETPKSEPPRTSGHLTRVMDIRHWSTPVYTRVVIDLERSVKFESHLLEKDVTHNKPRRLYVDLKDAYVSSDIESSIPIRNGLLQRARAGQYKKDVVRVVLDINSISGHKIFPLHDPFRIVVDVRGKEKKQVEQKKARVVKRKTRPVRKGIRKVKRPDQSVSLARQLGLSVKRIVIDPGHGGKDPGCYLKGGIREKNIVLKLAKTLRKKIEETLGCDVVLTRSKDVFVPLERRTAFANMKKADLFISLHVNAHEQKGVHGLETYFLNMATDARAVMVAARENATSEKNISDLQTILNDLMLNTKISESSKLAHDVQNGMLRKIRGKYRVVKSLGVKQAPFYVLIGAEMPAVLIETGFITNPSERKRLLSQTYLNSLADGIVNGLDQYIESIDQIALGAAGHS